MEKRALVLLSGGLDSMLALKLILDQNIEVVGLHMFTPFCKCKFCVPRFRNKLFSIPVKLLPLNEEYLNVVLSPKYGYGSNMNPCIDCRIFMLKKAKECMKEFNASFIVTGEVLDQRPMSQRKEQLKIIEREAGLEGLIVRPLSGKLLEPTILEKEGVLTREKFLDIKGRQRKKQIDLAYELGIFDFPTPSGGCLLTDPSFSKRFKDLLKYQKNISLNDVELLKVGRHFRLDENTKFVVSRDEMEKRKILNLLRDNDLIFEIDEKSPLGLYRGQLQDSLKRTSSSILLKYSKLKNQPTDVIIKNSKFQEIEKIPTSLPLLKGLGGFNSQVRNRNI